MKEFILQRNKETKESTLGYLYSFDATFLCYTLEDGKNQVKVPKKTRIPSGRYKITFRDKGTKIRTYQKRFGLEHNMLWIRNVPDFEYIYLHIGNTIEDTDGCILLGSDWFYSGKNYALVKSISSYLKVYTLISKLLNNKEEIWIVVKDIDYEETSSETGRACC
jgi:hypothetical protein